MRKSAVSVRSGAGMPAHMTRERNAGGGKGRRVKEEKGRDSMRHGGNVALHTCHYIWEATQENH